MHVRIESAPLSNSASNCNAEGLAWQTRRAGGPLKAVDREFPNFGFLGIFDISWIFAIYGTLGIDV